MNISFDVPLRDAGCKLGPFLRRQGVSASMVRRLKYEPQGLLVDGEREKTNRVLQGGECVSIELPEDEVPLTEPEDIPLPLVYESKHAMVFDKPAGLVMHPTLSHANGTMANGFAALMRQRGQVCAFRPIGRLDADTSGLVLCARNAFAAPLLAEGLGKTYLALVEGLVDGDGEVDLPLGAAPNSAVVQCVTPQGRPSKTTYRVLAHGRKCSLLWVRPKTGRTHQIRVHMAHLGHPLLGDGLYGGRKEEMERHALHCATLRFTEPMGEEVVLTAPLPSDMRTALERAGIQHP